MASWGPPRSSSVPLPERLAIPHVLQTTALREFGPSFESSLAGNQQRTGLHIDGPHSASAASPDRKNHRALSQMSQISSTSRTSACMPSGTASHGFMTNVPRSVSPGSTVSTCRGRDAQRQSESCSAASKLTGKSSMREEMSRRKLSRGAARNRIRETSLGWSPNAWSATDLEGIKILNSHLLPDYQPAKGLEYHFGKSLSAHTAPDGVESAPNTRSVTPGRWTRGSTPLTPNHAVSFVENPPLKSPAGFGLMRSGHPTIQRFSGFGYYALA